MKAEVADRAAAMGALQVKEAMNATLSGHRIEHEIATAIDVGLFGFIDMNRGDMQCS